MSIEVIYQGLTIAKGPSFRLQDGGVFVELDGPMPVATALSLAHGEHALHGRVRRVSEGSGAGMLIVPTETKKLPRWLVQLGPTSVSNVELEPEPVAAPAPEPAVAAAPEPAVAPAPESTPVAAEPAEAAPAATPTEAKSEAANAEPAAEAGEPAAASGHTPSEHDAAAKDEEEESKPTDKKPSAAAPANKKKKARKR
jgi:hypothetical protein